MHAIISPEATGSRELATRWRLVLGCVIGSMSGVAVVPAVLIASLMPALQADFGWSRTEISLALTGLIVVLVFTAPAVGWLCDRVEERRVAVLSLVALGLALLAVSRFDGSAGSFMPFSPSWR